MRPVDVAINNIANTLREGSAAERITRMIYACIVAIVVGFSLGRAGIIR